MNSLFHAGLLAAALLPFPLTAAGDATNLYANVRIGDPSTCLLVNQVGYDSVAAKTVVVQVFDPTNDPPSGFQVVNESDEVLFKGALVPRGRIHGGSSNDWGARYWTGDFTALRLPGTYRVRILTAGPARKYDGGARVREAELSSFWFQIGDGRLFHQTAFPASRFFYYQRCGFAVPGVHEACHLDDARLPDSMGGGHLDCTGGWHDAGDYNKYNRGYTPLAVYALTVLYRDGNAFLSDQERRQVLDEAQWGADWVLKMWQPGKGILYYTVTSGYDYFGPPASETDNIPGNADDRVIRGQGPQPMAAAALAALAQASGQAKYRPAAEDLWRGAVAAKTHKDFGGEISDDEYQGELLFADLELERLTGAQTYLDDAAVRIEAILKVQSAEGLFSPSLTGLGVAPAALAQFAQSHLNSPLQARIAEALRRWVKASLQFADNPFQITPWKPGIFFFRAPVAKFWAQGGNSMYLSQAWALYQAGNFLNEQPAFELADRQMDWVLGANPYNVCMMEGQGSFNFPGYHHRYAGDKVHWPAVPGQERGAIPGAIPNGLRRVELDIDRPFAEFVIHPNDHADWRSLEPWLPHNAFYILAVTSQARAHRSLLAP
jgi:hypothetical protein